MNFTFNEKPDSALRPLRPESCQLLLIDYQERLMPHMAESQRVTDNAVKLLKSAMILDMPVNATEQYPKGLGQTVEPLLSLMTEADVARHAKTKFDAYTDEIAQALDAQERKQVILAGVETHICIWQTAKALRSAGFEVYLAADACSSRLPEHKQLALDGLRTMGVTVAPVETFVYELLGEAGGPRFKQIAALYK